MPNGKMSFKFRGRTYGLEAIFSASEARGETYNAFGKEASFLGKLVKLGFLVQKDVVYHPDHWIVEDPDKQNNFHACKFTTTRGNVRLGAIQQLNTKR